MILQQQQQQFLSILYSLFSLSFHYIVKNNKTTNNKQTIYFFLTITYTHTFFYTAFTFIRKTATINI